METNESPSPSRPPRKKKEPQPGLWILLSGIGLMVTGIGFAVTATQQANLDLLREHGLTVPGMVLGTKTWTEEHRNSDGERETRRYHSVVVGYEHPTEGVIVKEHRVPSHRYHKYRGATPENPRAERFRILEVNPDRWAFADELDFDPRNLYYFLAGLSALFVLLIAWNIWRLKKLKPQF